MRNYLNQNYPFKYIENALFSIYFTHFHSILPKNSILLVTKNLVKICQRMI